VFACALLALGGAPRPALADDTLTVMRAAIAPNIFDLLDIVAEHLGFFKDEHLTIVEQLANSPAVAAQLVATGKGDLCALSAEAVLQGYPRGLRLQYFFSHTTRYTNVLAVRDDSPIRTLADFRGKNIGVINIGSAGEVTAQLTLAGVGLEKTDVTFSPIGVGPQALDAVANNRVDGIAYPYVEAVNIEVVGNFKMRIFRNPILKDISNAGYAAAPATIQARADALQRFTRAIVEAALFVHYNPRVAARFFLEAAGVRITPQLLDNNAREIALLEDNLPAADPANKRMGYMSPRGLEVLSRVLTDNGMTSQVVPASAIVTNQFIDYANQFDHKAVIALALRTH
jgi:NitT/TauT family transport system substrate-binding protein